MRRLLAALFVMTAGLTWLCQPTQAAEMRVALVIGNGAYQHAPRLPNPPNDAADIAAALKRDGFDTILATDLDKTGMDEATIRFARSARNADVALFYYSGHALQFGGVNYLAPIDAQLTDEADLRRMTRVDDIVSDLQQARNLRILVLDSCRDNPLADELKRSLGTTRAMSLQRGLAKIDTPVGMIVAYATQAGQTAADGAGRNSPYTSAFLKNIEAPDEIGVVFRRISNDVYQSTGRTQLPELSLSLTGEFYLKGTVAITAKQDSAATQQPIDTAGQAWIATQNTTSVSVLEDFIRQFGDTVYGSMARARLQELKKNQVATAPPVTAPAASPAAGPGSRLIPKSGDRPDAVNSPSANPSAAPAGSARIDGMPIRVGDNLAKVQDAYKTAMMPEPVSSIHEGETGLQLKSRGVWFFFSKDGKIDTVRLDAPFPGAVNGVRIGDTTAKMREVLGEPAKTLKNIPRQSAYLYYLDDETTARFDVGDDDKIRTVFLFK